MSLPKYFVLYTLTVVIFLILDFIWLGLITRNFYQQEIGHLITEKFKIIPALIFYFSYSLCLIIFVINPGLENKSFIKTIILGFIFGFITYATYDLTNYATLKDWTLKVVVVDILWGIFISGATSAGIYQISNLLKL